MMKLTKFKWFRQGIDEVMSPSLYSVDMQKDIRLLLTYLITRSKATEISLGKIILQLENSISKLKKDRIPEEIALLKGQDSIYEERFRVMGVHRIKEIYSALFEQIRLYLEVVVEQREEWV